MSLPHAYLRARIYETEIDELLILTAKLKNRKLAARLDDSIGRAWRRFQAMKPRKALDRVNGV